MSLISVEKAVELLRLDQVVAVPTETVYGLAGRIFSVKALERIFTTKERPLFDPLIVHVRDAAQARSLAAEWPEPLDWLTRKFWPGPLTVVVPKAPHVEDLISAGLNTVGLRMPSHPVALEILQLLDEPFAAPSANRFGRTSPTRAIHVETEFQGQVPVVDGGASEGGVESTVIRHVDGPAPKIEVLRPGLVTTEEIRQALLEKWPSATITRTTSSASPGHLEQHYQPRLPLLLVPGPENDQTLGRLRAHSLVGHRPLFNLKLASDARLAARELYHQLHRLSAQSEGVIVYWMGPEWNRPDWEAVQDRLTRASTPFSF